ncbi:MAG: hypothetical protein A3E82_07810 [Gammaproteobacteria bacterium RIFCSPHIGHO2_12_FULL_38_11]|nr:MAG: hypothetical protein A3E82_07810 [Gammaproteobacteria bacterium RIFCSPHIGHO2_12_FULL_38_11]
MLGKAMGAAARFFSKKEEAVTSSSAGKEFVNTLFNAPEKQYRSRGAEGGDYGTFSTETHIKPK